MCGARIINRVGAARQAACPLRVDTVEKGLALIGEQ